jgi:hypothetical protein
MGLRAAALALGITLIAAAPAGAIGENCPAGALPGSQPEPQSSGQPMVFGIAPIAQAGAVAGPQQQAKPEDPEQTRAALARLRGDRRFAAHLYLEFTNGPDMPERIQRAVELVDRYDAQGLEVEYVLAYRPRDRAGASDVAAYVAFVREMVGTLGTRPGLRSLQVTNEVNNSASPEASDGAYPGALDALVEGVIAADEETRARNLEHVEIGFNWMYRQPPDTDQRFWEYLRDVGGPRFVSAVDWVGADVYPGTFFPPAQTSYRGAVVNALDVLRGCYMEIPDIPDEVPIHITESGYPTGPGRSYEEQAKALAEMVAAYRDYSGLYNVTDYRWFLLRDGNSDVPDFQQQYGLLRDDYSPKPAFELYRELIAQHGEQAGAGAGDGGVEPEAAPRIRLRVTPRRPHAGRIRFRFRVSAARATIRLGGRRVRANRRGRATLRVTFRRPGVRRAVATKRGWRHGVIHLRVRR